MELVDAMRCLYFEKTDMAGQSLVIMNGATQSVSPMNECISQEVTLAGT